MYLSVCAYSNPASDVQDAVIDSKNANTRMEREKYQTFESYLDVGYDQPLRPQFHFTSRKNWLNDGNGMVYYDGEYHLFFQHNPLGVQWGNMTWGHAVSKDMVHWQQLPHAIMPYNGGTIYSGTAVVDDHNSLGMQTTDTKTLVACFTFAKEPFYQAMAYSTDKGRTFTLVNNGLSVIPNQGYDEGERDPKIFWHHATKKWVMVLWVKRGTPGKVLFFNSDNLTDWKRVSEFDRDWVFECMDFVELPVDGSNDNKKWLLYDASFDYEIGIFDGKTFTTDGVSHRGEWGNNYYAAQTFNNSPDGRTVMIGWMRGEPGPFVDAKMPFNQQMGFPCSIELRTAPEGIRLFRQPVREIQMLYAQSYSFANVSLAELADKLAGIEAELLDLSVEFEPGDAEKIQLNLRGLSIDYKDEAFFVNDNKTPAKPINGKVKVRILLDKASIEIFANEGAAASANYVNIDPENRTISLSADKHFMIHSFVVHELSSIWQTE